MNGQQAISYGGYDPAAGSVYAALTHDGAYGTDRFNRRLARLALVGTSIGLQEAYLAPAFSVQHILYGIAGIAALAAFAMGSNRLWSRFLVGIVVWWFMAIAVAAATSPYRAAIVPLTWKACLYLTVGILCGMAIANSQKSFHKYTRLMVFTALLSCVLAAVQAVTGKFYFLAASDFGAEYAQETAAASGRAYGFFGNPNGMAHWLTIPIGVTLARLAYPPREGAGWRPLVWLPILLGGMALTVSRSGVALTCLIIPLVMGRRVLKPKLILAAFASLFGGVLGVRFLAPVFFQGIIERFMTFGEDEGRLQLIGIAINSVTDRPLFGHGLHSFRILSGNLVAHNGFLEPLVELGLFGYTAVMLGIAGGVVSIWRCAFLARGTQYEWIWRGWAAGLTGLVLSEMVHGVGWRSIATWSSYGLAYVGVMLLSEQREAGQLTPTSTPLYPE